GEGDGAGTESRQAVGDRRRRRGPRVRRRRVRDGTHPLCRRRHAHRIAANVSNGCCRQRGGSCWTDQRLPSGSLKNVKEPQGKSCTSLASTPRPTSSARAACTSSTTSCSPATEPGSLSTTPVPSA